MGTAKRERQKQGRQARIAQAQAQVAKRKRTRSALLLGGLVAILVVATLVIGGLGDDGDDQDLTAGTGTTQPGGTSSTAPGETPPTVAVTFPPAGETLTGPTPCPAADGSSARTTTFAAAPPTCIDGTKTYTATFSTTEGDFTVALDAAAAPITVNNFVVLARYHFYDGVTFHRIIPEFMIQGGDPVGPSPGVGGPGYSIPDELPTGENAYPPGTLAMANSGPDTGGSQFFVMATGSSGLPNNYAVFGHVTEGQDVVDAINQNGDAASNGTPTAEINIVSVTISES